MGHVALGSPAREAAEGGCPQCNQLTLAAYCKNSVDGLWYCFDDSEVQQLAENEVCKPTAYILFYQRRTAIPAWSANSSLAGKSSSCCRPSQPSLRVTRSETFLLTQQGLGWAPSLSCLALLSQPTR